MPISNIKLYQQEKDPSQMQLVLNREGDRMDYYNLTPEQFSQLKSLGVPAFMSGSTTYKASGANQFEQGQLNTDSLFNALKQAATQGSWEGQNPNYQKWADVFSNVNVGNLPTSGGELVTPEMSQKWQAGAYGGMEGLLAANPTLPGGSQYKGNQQVSPAIEAQWNTLKSQAQNIFSQAGMPSADQLGNSGDWTMPNVSSSLSGIGSASGAVSGMDVLIKEKERQAAEAKAAKEKLEAGQATQPKSWTDWLKGMGKQTPAEERSDLMAETGMEATQYFADQKAAIAEIGTLTEEYNNKEAEMNQKLLKAEDRLAPMTYIRGEQALIQKAYNIELSKMSANIKAKAAVMEANQGNFNEARSFVNEAVQDYTFELQQEYNVFSSFIEANDEKIKELDTQYQKALDDAMNLKLTELTMAKEEASQVGNLMIQYPQAGIKIGDSLALAQQKASAMAAPEKPDIFGTAEGGYYQQEYNPATGQWEVKPVAGGAAGGGTSAADTKIMKEAEAAQAQYQTFFNELKSLTSNLDFANKYPIVGTLPGRAWNWLTGSVTKTDNAWVEYNSWKQAASTKISKAFGNIGTPSDKDVARIMNSLPSFGDTKEQAEAKITNLESTLIGMQQAMINYYSQTGSQFNGNQEGNLLENLDVLRSKYNY